MPFIRYTRDKRGYETTFVMHGYRPAQGPQRTRVLYLFRSPSHLHMGRRPLDEEAREALEHTHPDLSFDWSALGRESEEMRPTERARDERRGRRGQQPQQARSRPAAPTPAATIDDQSLLGRTVGSATAARFRARYGDLLQRIARRARTPEERDRLTEQAQRLNPDDWPDGEAVRAHAETIEAEWDRLAAELPARRRGRRGGRRRDETASAIMTADGETDAREDVDDATGFVDPGGSGDDAGRVGPDPADTSTDDARAERDDVSGDDEFRQN